MEIISAKSSISSKDTFLTLSILISSKDTNGSYVIVETSKALASFKTFFDIFPKPMRPNIFPFNSLVGIDVLGHFPFWVSALTNLVFFSNESEGYRYSNQLSKSKMMTPSLIELLSEINNIFKTNYNGILVNKYKTGEDYISAHSDDERNLDNSGVVAISYGAPRKFRIRDKKTKKIVKDILLSSYSLLQMGGKFQQEFTHEIPIEKKVKEERISFTFRKHIE